MKRFTATEKWDMAWFHELEPVLKCLWQFMCDRCDAAGVWEPNWPLASFLIGKKVTEDSLSAFGDRVIKIKGGKLWLSSFIAFQYGKLSKDCRPHLKIFESLNKHGIEYTEGQELVVRSRVGHVSESKRKAIYARDGGKCVYCGSTENLEPDHIIPRKKGGDDKINNLITACHDCNTARCFKPIAEFLALNPNKDRVLEIIDRVQRTLLEEEEDKEEDKDKEPEEEHREPIVRKDIGTLEEVKAYVASENLPESDAVWFFNKCEGNGWTNGGKKIKDWKATVRSWVAALYMPSQKGAKTSARTCPIPEHEQPEIWDPMKA